MGYGCPGIPHIKERSMGIKETENGRKKRTKGTAEFDKKYSDDLYASHTEENQLKALAYAGQFARNKKEAQQIIVYAMQGHDAVSEEVIMQAKEQFYLFFYDYVRQQCQNSLSVELNWKTNKQEEDDLIEDLVQSCFEGIFANIDRYDPQRASLTTFFSPIMRDARDRWRADQKMIAVSKSKMQKDREVKRALNQLENNNKDSELFQLIEMTGLKPGQIILSKLRIEMNNSIVSIDADEMSEIPSDFLEPERQVLNKERSQEIMDAVHLLSPKEKLAFFYTNGLEEYDGTIQTSEKMSINKAAETLHISEQELHRYQASAIEKLKNQLGKTQERKNGPSMEDRILSKNKMIYSRQPEDAEVEDVVDAIIEIIEFEDAVDSDVI